MTITAQSILTLTALLTACGGIITAMFRLVHWLDRQKKQDMELQEIRTEQCVLVYGVLACLDGLKQLNCNGTVTEAHNKLEKHINKAAHRQE